MMGYRNVSLQCFIYTLSEDRDGWVAGRKRIERDQPQELWTSCYIPKTISERFEIRPLMRFPYFHPPFPSPLYCLYAKANFQKVLCPSAIHTFPLPTSLVSQDTSLRWAPSRHPETSNFLYPVASPSTKWTFVKFPWIFPANLLSFSSFPRI